MDKIIGVVGGGASSGKEHIDDDFSDRLVHKYSTIMCVVFAFIVTGSVYVGDPIHCWAPAHFSDNWQEYANTYCWVQNTYYLPFGEYIPKAHEADKRQIIPYYQWMPFILLIQALLFYLPTVVWRFLNTRSGIDLDAMVSAAHTMESADSIKKRKIEIANMVRQMDRFLSANDKSQRSKGCTCSLKNICSRTLCRTCGRSHGNYLSASYIFVKLLYIVDVIAQLFALNYFLGQSFSMYGFDFMRSGLGNTTAYEHGWGESERFPRVTMCDMMVRRLGNVQRYTVQCVLPINLFTEKIYLFLWFWMLLVAFLLIVDLFKWIVRSLNRVDRSRYVKKHLYFMGVLDGKGQPIVREFFNQASIYGGPALAETTFGANDNPGKEPDETAQGENDITVDKAREATRVPMPRARPAELKSLISRYAQEYLKMDGLFVLRMLGHNTNAITSTQFNYSLFRNYQQKADSGDFSAHMNDSENSDED